MRALSEFSPAEFEHQVMAWGFPAVHARRILRQLYTRGIWAPDDPGIPAKLRQKLAENISPAAGEVAVRSVADDGTVKFLLRFGDQRTVESVFMPGFRGDRAAGCLSSQIGCAMGCDFCATAQAGFARNLSAGEIVEQFLALQREAGAAGRQLRTIVFMGMGEPMLNLGAVMESVRRISGSGPGGLGRAEVTVSTVGIVPGIAELAASGLRASLAVSLHAPDNATRARLLPAGRHFGVAEIMGAADRYQADTGRIVNIQYCLLAGVNDSPEQARELAALMVGRRMHVNLLHYNPTGPGLSGTPYTPSSDEAVAAFQSVLRDHGVVTHRRQPRGRTIDAACGQLRRRAG